MANSRKKTLKKAVKGMGGLLGRAGRGLMGRRGQIERAVSGNGSRRKTTPKKKRKRY